MILGKIIGKVNTTSFTFIVEGLASKFDYLQVMHKEAGYVLCQVLEMEKEQDNTIAKCIALGYKDSEGRVRQIRTPFEPGTEVLKAEDDFIQTIIKLGGEEKGAYIGMLEGKGIKVYIDLNKVLTKHLAVLAKSGAGKSYAVAALLEEIIEKNIPLLVIDPHGEYNTLRQPNDKPDDIKLMPKFGIKAKGYPKAIQEYSDQRINENAKPLKLSEKLEPSDLVHMLPAKLTNNQLAMLHTATNGLSSGAMSFNELIAKLNLEENVAKFSLISMIQQLSTSEFFSSAHTPYNELIQSGKCTIINLKGVEPVLQEIIVYKLFKDLFEERKKGKIPPFFAIIEEAHNFIPEKNFGEAKSSKILRTVGSEGRKFGLGLCIISQRPARVEKNVLSQCTTQIILKVTNPNDLRAIMNSVEGVTTESENELINLPIGSAMITGVVEMPLFVNIRPRKSKHGGEAVDMLSQGQKANVVEEEKFMEDLKDFNDKDILPIIQPNMTAKDIALMSEQKIKKVKAVLYPCYVFVCEDSTGQFNLLMDLFDGKVVVDTERFTTKFLPELDKLSLAEVKVLEACFKLKRIDPEKLVARNGFDFTVRERLKKLTQKGYLIFDVTKKVYTLSDKYVLSNLSKYRCEKKIEFVKINYDKKLEPKISVDDLKAKLSKFATVKDQRECFAVKYDVEYS